MAHQRTLKVAFYKPNCDLLQYKLYPTSKYLLYKQNYKAQDKAKNTVSDYD